jgi:YidC/Oxa1 family membrane protein insertase
MVQIPFLITWFLSLRYVAALPEVFPSVTQSFLWIPDISTYDPYFILPLISALFSSYAIIISPGLKNANVMPLMEPFVKYLKYVFIKVDIFHFYHFLSLGFSQQLSTYIGAFWPSVRLLSWAQ